MSAPLAPNMNNGKLTPVLEALLIPINTLGVVVPNITWPPTLEMLRPFRVEPKFIASAWK